MGTVGVIGTGSMGAAMVRRLLQAGHDVHIHDCHPPAMSALTAEGATAADSVTELSAQCRVVISSLPGPVEFETAGDELAGCLRPGDVHVGHSTVSIESARRVQAKTEAAGGIFLDAPVSGGPMGVSAGNLTVMVSGEAAGLDAAREFLDAYAAKVFELGDRAGAATLVKLINNAIFLCSGLVHQEAITLAAKAGLDAAVVDSVLGSSSASVYMALAQPTVSRAWDDAFFSLALAEKDIALALDSARTLTVPMPMIDSAHQHYLRARAMGLGDKVFYATLAAVEDAAKTRVPARDGGQK